MFSVEQTHNNGYMQMFCAEQPHAERARRIKNKPIVNQDPRAAETARLKQQIHKLRLELLAQAGSEGCPPHHKCLEEYLANLVTKNRTLLKNLTML
jgi:kinesin family protein 4/21/27